MKNAAPETTTSAEASASEPQEEMGHGSVSNPPDATSFSSATQMSETHPGVSDDTVAASPGVEGEETPPAPAVSYVSDRAGDGARPKRHRVREAAREAVAENLRPRVEKLRQASNVVLDEAAYDPSLRFVLIALVLFLIFLVILLVSRILG